ncbi:hypothetical protein LXL04_021478 [Taraxacum kok-saghyz]
MPPSPFPADAPIVASTGVVPCRRYHRRHCPASSTAQLEKDVVSLVAKKQKNMKISISFELETLEADEVAEGHIRQFMFKLTGTDAVSRMLNVTEATHGEDDDQNFPNSHSKRGQNAPVGIQAKFHPRSAKFVRILPVSSAFSKIRPRSIDQPLPGFSSFHGSSGTSMAGDDYGALVAKHRWKEASLERSDSISLEEKQLRYTLRSFLSIKLLKLLAFCSIYVLGLQHKLKRAIEHRVFQVITKFCKSIGTDSKQRQGTDSKQRQEQLNIVSFRFNSDVTFSLAISAEASLVTTSADDFDFDFPASSAFCCKDACIV